MTTGLRRRPPEAGPDEARELARMIGECTAAAIPRSALVLRLSLLPRERAQPHHLRLARAALDPLLSADRARLFGLSNRDIVVVWKGEAARAVAACRTAIGHLFADETGTGPEDPAELLQELSLPEAAGTLLALLERSLAPDETAEAADTAPAPPLDIAQLSLLELSLQQTDVARFARRRPVCRGGPGGRLDLQWEKRVLSVEELAAALLPGRAVRADPWLFRRLTRTLDRRMLVLLSHPDELRDAGPFSLNLNVASILSAEFLRFDAGLPARLRGEVVLELQPPDLLADPSAFQFAREFARVRGYGLALRSLTPMLLRVFALPTIGMQFLQLRWDPELPARSDPLAGADPAQLVLTRADSAAALAWGRGAGIRLFRGPAVHPS